MKKLFIKFSMLLFVLGMSVNVAWAQEDVKVYFASLKAQSSPESTGSGQVKLTWVDITGAPLTVDLAKQLNYAAFQDPTWMAKESAYDGFGETAQVLGGTMSALDGMETMIATMPQIFMTSFVYYYAQSQPANGSYFSDWTFIDPAVTKMTEPMGGKGDYTTYYGSLCMNCGHYDNPFISPCFKVLPDSANNALYSDQEALGTMAYTVAQTPGKYNNLYAVFNKYLLSNPQAENGHMNANESSATFKVSVDVEGDASQLKADYADFDFPASDFVDNAEGTWSWVHDSENPIENINASKTRYNFTITFAPKTTSVGRKNATLTIRMAHVDPSKASTLNIPLSVDVRPAATADATLYDGKTPTETSGTLSDMIAKAHNTDKIVVLNRDYAAALDLNNKNVTIDLNGYDITNTFTVSGGDVTIAYSKFGGKISSVNVSAGQLTLNGGTIDASGNASVIAVTVASGATLIQNGATIKATATTVFATAIEVNGRVEINDGVMTAHANQYGAFVAKVNAGGKLTVNGGTLSATVNQTNNPIPSASNQATWSNVYSVFVSSGTGEAQINGGTFNATSDYAGAFAVCGLASMGKLTVEKKAVVYAHSGCNEPTAYAVGLLNESNTINEADATINGGKFSATYMEGGSVVTPCRPFLCAVYKNLTFKSGYINADFVYVRNTGIFPMSGMPVEPTLYNVVRDGKDWNEGWRYIAVDESNTTALAAGVPACRIGTTGYTKLEDALAYANNNPSEENIVIFMTNDYTLPAGYYTLPANATIVVPMSDDQAKEVNKTAPRVSFNDADRSTPYVQPTEFRRLTIASGVNMDVFGNIEMTCSQFASNEAYTGQPTGAYGHIVMEEGSHMTLQDGSEVRAWGFMTGKGEIDARRGSVVREMFQLGDWKGAMTSVQIVGLLGGEDYQKKIFPVTQYFIQNIESPVKYHPGSLLSTSAAVSEGLGFLSVSMTAADIGLIGVSRANSGGADDPAIFLMDIAADAENTWVRKWYDVENDVQVYDINSGAHIGSMVLDMGELFVPIGNIGTVPIKLNSSKFDLPLTCNFKIHLLTGGMDFKQNTSLLPGAEVEVDKEATVSVAQNPSDTEHTGALYVYDATEWGKYAYCNEYNGENMVNGTAYTKVVRYAPSWNGRPTKRDEQTKPASAKINVHGTFKTATGFVYTSESGANIFSSNEDAGTFIFNDAAADAGTRTVYNVKGSSNLDNPTTFNPARLRNGDGTYVNTSIAQAGDAYCYINDEWTTMYPDENNPCFMVKHNVNGDIYYAKPAEYVALANGMTPNADHTYSDAAGAGRLFILMDNCQWWEVENVDNLYHCIHPNNDTYYYWDEDEEMWLEQKYTITWKNWNGDIIQTADKDGNLQNSYDVTYGTMAEFLGTNPTRESNIDYTYDFTGWSPALGPVTSDVTYTATYEQKDRMYTITFRNEGGTLIETQFLKHNDVPVCENTPTKIGHYLEWVPAISPVIGDQIYIAKWNEELPTEWDVTFVNNAGGELQATAKVGVNEHPTYNGSTPTKENADHSAYSSNEYTYTFSGWSAVIDGVAQQFAAGAELPYPTAPTTYTAVYTQGYQTYTVTFQDENGSEIEHHEYKWGETPVCSATPTKENTAEYTYSFAWTPQIQTVQGVATYRAVFTPTTNKYTVKLQSNNESVCTFSGAGIYNFGSTINVEATIGTGYTFDHWDGVNWTIASGTIPSLESDVTLTLYVKPNEEIANLSVEAGVTQAITPGTKCQDFILNSNGSASASVTNLDNLTVFGNCYYDLTQTFTAGKWYAIAVPWQVVASQIKADDSALSWNSGNYLAYYDGAIRAAEGKVDACWKYLSNSDVLQPGCLYMIYLKNNANVLRFPKKAGIGSPKANDKTSVATYASSEATDANWNGIANPATYYAYINAGATDGQGQVYNADEERYDLFEMDENKLIVGQPIFVQAPAEKSIVVNTSTYSAAPARRLQNVESIIRFDVRLTLEDKQTDRLIVRVNEDKEKNTYVIGQDLVKFGVSSKVAQMWINRYDAKLCVNTVAPEGDATNFPMSIFAPAAGDYTLHLTPYTSDSDYALYLTFNGEAIWNLSDGAYTLNLNKGTADNYGLRVSARAPQVVTGCDEAIVDAKGETRKVLINNQVFIIRGDKMYSTDGRLVK